jgi:uncharacterized membrane protein YoaK (UPF0700 family)
MNKITTILTQFSKTIFLKKQNLHLGILLTFVAGAVNAGGFLCVGQYTSHMTGIASSIADLLALAKFHLAFLGLVFLLSFIFGAGTTAILINIAKNKNHSSKLAMPLMLEIVLLLILGLASIGDYWLVNLEFLVICMLCFMMGLQNAMITKISNVRMRTTHVTGLSTDIGIQIGKLIYKFLGGKEVKINYGNLVMQMSILLTFLFGGLVGALIFINFGFFFVAQLAIILIILPLLISFLLLDE